MPELPEAPMPEEKTGTEKEFEQQIKRRLEYLREGINVYLYKDHLEYIREEIQKGRFTLQDIGTSEEELEELRIKSCKEVAQGWLQTLRKDPYGSRVSLAALREEIKEGRFTLQDIGTSEEELEELRK